MSGGRHTLCNRCGSSRWEELSETHIRCAECGLGATRRTLTFYRSPSYDAFDPTEIARREQAARERAAQAEGTFSHASFAPIGLDPRWIGLRWFGGSGGSNGFVTHLELAHGDDSFDDTQPQVRVGVTVAQGSEPPELGLTMVRWTVTRSLLQHFWRETGVLPDDVRRAAFTIDRRNRDPVEPWDATSFRLDGDDVQFRVLARDEYWIGQASTRDAIISVQARGWPTHQTDLVTINDLGPYVNGSIEIGSRPR